MNRANQPGWKKDGSLAFWGGVDRSIPPSNLDRTQCAAATNTSFRGGFLGPRMGFKNRVLQFNADSSLQTAFETGRFQHASFYDGNGKPCLLSSHGGRLFRIDLQTYIVTEITPLTSAGASDANSPTQPLGWSVQAENYWIYQDNQSAAIIYNGSTCRRSNPATYEVPCGNVMAYTMGRLVVALPNRSSFRVGDIVFGPSGTVTNGYRDAMLHFTENNYLNEGGDFVAKVFGAPSNSGPILAMKAGAMTDTQLGQGPLVVGTPYTVFTVSLPFDRTQWKNMQQALQTVNPLNGPMSQTGTVLVNADLWYRAVDGIRSYVLAQRQFMTWGNTSQSAELGDLLSRDTMSLLEHCSGTLFDNRLIMTVSPVDSANGVYHRGIVVLDYNLVSGLRNKLPPAWEDVWSGMRVLQIVKGIVDLKERCWVYTLNNDNEIELWELLPEAKFDNIEDRISWSVELPSYNCNNSDEFKRLETGRIIFDELEGQLDCVVKYRTDLSPCWNAWDSFTICAKREDCGEAVATTTTANFTIPGVGANVQVPVADNSDLTAYAVDITIGGKAFVIVSVDAGNNVTVRNDTLANVGIVVASGAAVSSYACSGPHTYREQERTPIKLREPPDTFQTVSKLKNRTGYEFQVRLELTGYAKIRQLRIYCIDEPESLARERTAETCADYEECCVDGLFSETVQVS